MRSNADEVWLDALNSLVRNIVPQSSRDGAVVAEVIGFQTSLAFPMNNIVLNAVRKFSLSYACAEVLWYLSGESNIDMIKFYAPQYERFAEDGHAYGAYGKRWGSNPGFVTEAKGSYKNQITAVCDLLEEKPDSRQAVVTMWDSGDLIHAIDGDHKDLPCTLSLQFLVRAGRLHMIATMRSNDVWLGLPYDLFAFTTIQAIVAQWIGLGLGTYIHQAGSEHLYERNYDKAVAASNHDTYARCYPSPSRWFDPCNDVATQVARTVDLERQARMYGWNDQEVIMKSIEAGLHPMFKDLLLGCTSKWTDFDPRQFTNSAYKSAMERSYYEDGHTSGSRQD